MDGFTASPRRSQGGWTGARNGRRSVLLLVVCAGTSAYEQRATSAIDGGQNGGA